ncbi:MAG: cytochrome c peroxidase [Gemmataceae bacterium]
MARTTFGCVVLGLAAVAVAADLPLPKDTLPADLPLGPVPASLGERPVPADNPLTSDRVRLGRKLFFDPVLSGDRTVSCASCHLPEKGFSGGAASSLGVNGQPTRRRSPSLVNRGFGASQFWDGRAASLEEQALRPIADPTEMGNTVAEAVRRLSADAGYKSAFDAAFPGEGVTPTTLAKALAGFQRVLVRGDGPIDRFRKGARSALSEQAAHGFWLYESKGGCWRCHGSGNFTDEKFHNTGVSWGKEPLDLGRFEVTKDDADRGRFKTPSLRGVGLSAPYMHDGSLKTLEDVIEFYDRGGAANPHLDPAIKPLNLTAGEKAALVAFLKAL